MKCEFCNGVSRNINHFYTCHICGKEICIYCDVSSLEDNDTNCCLDCKPDSYSYPKGFYNFADGKPMSDYGIKNELNRIQEMLKTADVGEYYTISCGNVLIFGSKLEDEYVFRVCRNYEEVSFDLNMIDKVKF